MPDPTLAHLIEERLPEQRYGVFFSTGEGSFFPDGTEESSGCVVAEDGTHWQYWTGWQDGLAFERWEPLDRYGDWRSDSEYLDARREAGLVAFTICSEQ